MKTKQVYTLGIILIILTVAVVIKQQQRPQELVRQDYVPLDFKVDAVKVHSIKITKPPVAAEGEQSLAEESVSLVLRKDGWKVSSLWNARADRKKIENFLAEVSGAKGEMRADNKALFDDFGIAAEDSYRIKLADASGNSLLDFLISMKKADYRFLFVRKPDSAKVFLTEANFYGLLGIYGDPKETDLNKDYWADMKIADFDTAAVNSIQVSRLGDASDLVTNIARTIKEGTDQKQWKFVSAEGESEASVDAAKVKKFLNDLTGYSARKVLDPEAKNYGFENFTFQLTLGLESGESVVYTVGEAGEESQNYPLQVTGEPAVFELSKYYVENMNVDNSKFAADPPEETDETEAVTSEAE